MPRLAFLVFIAFVAAGPAQASIACVVRPSAGEATTLRLAPFSLAPALARLERGRQVRDEGIEIRGWRLVEAWPPARACCADASETRWGWAQVADLDDCG
ncbi:MAG: hypothetical protein HZY79_14095 [Rhodoblastus sp.]|nr:MAG: hypothetical protein HZY79_14095 [Rhodoblastus sp.]